MFNNQVMAVHKKSAGLSIFSQNFKWTFYETLNLGYKFLASKHYPYRAFSTQKNKTFGVGNLDIPGYQYSPPQDCPVGGES